MGTSYGQKTKKRTSICTGRWKSLVSVAPRVFAVHRIGPQTPRLLVSFETRTRISSWFRSEGP